MCQPLESVVVTIRWSDSACQFMTESYVECCVQIQAWWHRIPFKDVHVLPTELYRQPEKKDKCHLSSFLCNQLTQFPICTSVCNGLYKKMFITVSQLQAGQPTHSHCIPLLQVLNLCFAQAIVDSNGRLFDSCSIYLHVSGHQYHDKIDMLNRRMHKHALSVLHAFASSKQYQYYFVV